MAHGRDIISLVGDRQDLSQFRRAHWTGNFAEYLDVVRSTPTVTRNAYQRIYDMVLSYGTETYESCREKHTHYKFFDDPLNAGRDAVFGLEDAICSLVNAFKSAAHGYGIEKRVLLLSWGQLEVARARLLGY